MQPKNISFPTDAKLLHAAIRGLNRLANKHGVRLRQSYLRVAKRAAMMAGRYAHAKAYVHEVAFKAGFRVNALLHEAVRQEAGAPVPGLLAVLERTRHDG